MISKAAMRALTEMRDAEAREAWANAEIVCEGRTCYLGLRSISRATVNELLRYVLVRQDSESGTRLERYSINEEGLAIVVDPSYRPKILEAFGRPTEPSGEGAG